MSPCSQDHMEIIAPSSNRRQIYRVDRVVVLNVQRGGAYIYHSTLEGIAGIAYSYPVVYRIVRSQVRFASGPKIVLVFQKRPVLSRGLPNFLSCGSGGSFAGCKTAVA